MCCCKWFAAALGDGAGTPPAAGVFRMSRLIIEGLRPVEAGTKAWQPGRMMEDEDEDEVLVASRIPAARAA